MENLTNRQLQRKRIIRYFVDAATMLIDTEGLYALSIRKVAEQAGYNSATLYHYFSNLKHLTYFSCIRYLKEYADDLSSCLAAAQTPLEQYFKIWECFCTHAYQKPEIYELLFFENLADETFDSSFKSYYDMFPEELTEGMREYYDMLMENDIYTREFLALEKTCRKLNTQMPEQELRHIAEMNILIFRGMLANRKEKSSGMTLEESVDRTLLYMKKACLAFGLV